MSKKFEVTAPNGKTYVVEGPDTATQTDAIAQIKQRYPHAAQNPVTSRLGEGYDFVKGVVAKPFELAGDLDAKVSQMPEGFLKQFLGGGGRVFHNKTQQAAKEHAVEISDVLTPALLTAPLIGGAGALGTKAGGAVLPRLAPAAGRVIGSALSGAGLGELDPKTGWKSGLASGALGGVLGEGAGAVINKVPQVSKLIRTSKNIDKLAQKEYDDALAMLSQGAPGKARIKDFYQFANTPLPKNASPAWKTYQDLIKNSLDKNGKVDFAKFAAYVNKNPKLLDAFGDAEDFLRKTVGTRTLPLAQPVKDWEKIAAWKKALKTPEAIRSLETGLAPWRRTLNQIEEFEQIPGADRLLFDNKLGDLKKLAVARDKIVERATKAAGEFPHSAAEQAMWLARKLNIARHMDARQLPPKLRVLLDTLEQNQIAQGVTLGTGYGAAKLGRGAAEVIGTPFQWLLGTGKHGKSRHDESHGGGGG